MEGTHRGGLFASVCHDSDSLPFPSVGLLQNRFVKELGEDQKNTTSGEGFFFSCKDLVWVYILGPGLGHSVPLVTWEPEQAWAPALVAPSAMHEGHADG